MLPVLFGENLFDDFFDDSFERELRAMNRNPLYGKHGRNLMKTDVREKSGGYELTMDLPGFKKDEVTAELNDGYLTISAAKGLDKDEQEKESGRYIRRERYAGACQRSFYVGEEITEDDIRATFKHGILRLFVQRKNQKHKLRRSTVFRSMDNCRYSPNRPF